MSGTSEVRLPGWDQISLIGNTTGIVEFGSWHRGITMGLVNRSTAGLVSVLEVLSSVVIIKGEALGPDEQAFGGSLVLLSRGILLDQLV